MTKLAITRAFQKLDTTEQAAVLGELAAALAQSLKMMDERDANIFEQCRGEEPHSTPVNEIRRRLNSRRQRIR